MFTRKLIQDLADQEYIHFESLKLEGERGVPNINVRECEHYMRIWAGIMEFMNDTTKEFRDLAPFEKMEIIQAMEE